MTVIVCLGNSNGMAFNERRQSRDSRVLEDIRALFPNGIKIAPYSEKLVSAAKIRYTVCEDLASEAEGAMFVETFDPTVIVSRINRLVIYRWNREYPADLFCTLDPKSSGWTLKSVEEFCGTSHETVTREIFEKNR